eukprot:gene14429-20435_t
MQLPPYQPESLAAALVYGEEVFSYVQEQSKEQCSTNLPRGPSSWSEIQTFVHDRDEEKRKAKDKQKSSKVPPFSPDNADNQCPKGCNIGSKDSASAFWVFMEDYFRDLTSEDFKGLMPCFLDPAQDTDFTVPFLGREGVQPDEKSKPVRGKRHSVAQEEVEEDGRRRNRLSRSSKLVGEDPMGSVNAADSFGQPGPLSLSSCTDVELSTLGNLLAKLGVLQGNTSFLAPPAPHKESAGIAESTPLVPPLATASNEALTIRMQIEEILHQLGSIAGGLCTQGAGTSADEPSTSQLIADHGELGDFVHPMTRLMLGETPSAYVMDTRHCCNTATGDLDEMDGSDTPSAAAPKPAGKGQPGKKKKSVKSVKSVKAVKSSPPAEQQTPDIKEPFAFPAPLGVPLSPTPLTAPPSLLTASTPQATPRISRADSGGVLPAADVTDGKVAPTPGPSTLRNTASVPQPCTSAGEEGAAAFPAVGPDISTGRGRSRSSINYSMLNMGVKDTKEKLAPLPPPSKAKAKPPRPSTSKSGLAPSKSSMSLKIGLGDGAASNPTSAAIASLISSAPVEGSTEEQWPILDKCSDVIAITSAPVEGSTEEQWPILDKCSDIIAIAPDDEILAEMLALQSELAQQVAINRRRAAQVMLTAVQAVPAQKESAKQIRSMEEELKSYVQYKLERRRAIKREKRETERRQAFIGSSAELVMSPRGRPVGRPKKLDNMYLNTDAMELDQLAEPESASPTEVPMTKVSAEQQPLDPFAHRGDDEEAICAVCGDGTSISPNEIVFCERCDLAVHQHCYGEWLCWPCLEYEEQQRREGIPQNKIRPPRWEMAAKGITPAQLPGGTCEAECALCPVKFGAFKKTVDTKQWVHLVCALWHPETSVRSGNVCAAVENLKNVGSHKFKGTCNVCRITGAGAVLKCNFGHCQALVQCSSATSDTVRCRRCAQVQLRTLSGGKEREERVSHKPKGTCNVGRITGAGAVLKCNFGHCQGTCNVCRITGAGAVLKCNFGHCQATFHPICGRRQAQYIPAKIDTSGRLIFRAYCLQHSEQLREKDLLAGNTRGYIDLASHPKAEEVLGQYIRKGDLPKGDQKGGSSCTDGVKPVRQAKLNAAAKVSVSASATEDDEEVEAIAQHTHRLADLAALGKKEEDEIHMYVIRYELERVRLIVDQVRRREKLKKGLVRNLDEVLALRERSPTGALAAMRHLGQSVEPSAEHPQQQTFCLGAGSNAAACALPAPRGPPPPPPLQPIDRPGDTPGPPPPPPLTPLPASMPDSGDPGRLLGSSGMEGFEFNLRPVLTNRLSAESSGGAEGGAMATRRGRINSTGAPSPMAKQAKPPVKAFDSGSKQLVADPISAGPRGSKDQSPLNGLNDGGSMSPSGRPKRKIVPPRSLSSELPPPKLPAPSPSSPTASHQPRSKRLAARGAASHLATLDSPCGLKIHEEMAMDDDDDDFMPSDHMPAAGATIRAGARQRAKPGTKPKRVRAAEAEDDDVVLIDFNSDDSAAAEAEDDDVVLTDSNSDDRAPTPGRGSRRQNGKKQRPAGDGQEGGGVQAGAHNTRHAMKVDREMLMTKVEADSTNTKLPKSFRYIRVDTLLNLRPKQAPP